MNPTLIDLMYEAKLLKDIPRSGYQFLGVGRESIAEHTFMTTFIANIMAMLHPEVDALKLLRMCLLHDLPEARTGDLNAVQKKYVTADELKAISEMTENLPFGAELRELLAEFRGHESLESRLAHDADQLALLIDLKSLQDIGHASPMKWIPYVRERMTTETGQKMAKGILENEWDNWWVKDFS